MNEEAKKILQHFGYEGHEKLMNAPTGSIDTAKNWALEASDWENPYEEFSSLEEVQEQENDFDEEVCPFCRSRGLGCTFCDYRMDIASTY